jgi:hypothetical protein|tara:strand:+ start:179 stop:355 length:177 start_codon:yes stop_codon:yes gene_type:complete
MECAAEVRETFSVNLAKFPASVKARVSVGTNVVGIKSSSHKQEGKVRNVVYDMVTDFR